ncbi:hypothetical protein BDW75DRAFT_211603 [Aspergillus navahoensis]
MLLETKEAFLQFSAEDLIAEEFNTDLGAHHPWNHAGSWNNRDDESLQLIQGALIYDLAHILHNLSDLEAVKLLKKIAQADGGVVAPAGA